MSSLADYIFDTSFLEELFIFLETSHNIHPELIDSDGNVVRISKSPPVSLAAEKYVPFAFHQDIGGVRFKSESEITLKKNSNAIKLCINAINYLLQREIELQQTSDEMLHLSEQLNFLLKLSQRIAGVKKISRFCEIILEEISKSIKADFSFIVTKGRWDEELILYKNISSAEVSQIQKQGNFINANKKNTVIFTLNDGASALISPIKSQQESNGLMAFFRSREKRFFTSYEKKFVSIIEHIISPNIEILKLYDSLQELYLNTVKALASAIDAKDEYTHGHSFRVAELSVAIGKVMNIPEAMLQDLEIAAYMHDLGKIGISESILGKPSKLTKEEYEEIKKHPVLTNKILQPIHLPDFIVDAAVQHHERLDGRGYPLGLRGDEISQFAKIIAVADVFDAMTSNRPYRDALSVEKALEIISNGIDHEFDREAVFALIMLLDNKEGEKFYKAKLQVPPTKHKKPHLLETHREVKDKEERELMKLVKKAQGR